MDIVRENSTRTDVGQRIRAWRLRRELSQAEVARLAGITQASLSNYENGKRDLPLTTLLGVTRALNVSLGDLLDMPDVIVVRDSVLGRAVEQLQVRVPAGVGTYAASYLVTCLVRATRSDDARERWCPRPWCVDVTERPRNAGPLALSASSRHTKASRSH